MSGIVLSASVRQNLLSLQSTADLLATTQNRLSTGKKVNTALDNPTNFFTAQSLDARAGDINNLLDGIGNGVQVLQAANTGITSLQKLVDYRQVDRQPGAAERGRLLHQVERLRDDRRRDRDRPARHHDLHQRDRDLQRAVHRHGRRHDARPLRARRSAASPPRWSALPHRPVPAPRPLTTAITLIAARHQRDRPVAATRSRPMARP